MIELPRDANGMIELPRDANGRVIPLDTEVLYDECGSCGYFDKGGGDCSKCARPDGDTCGCTASVLKDIKKRIRRLRGEDK
nr:MAG: hypothetical protein [Bacteriophage sp.]